MNSKWEILREQFLAELFSTKITLKSWCEKMDISYHSARRYIKVGEEKKLHFMRKNNNAQVQKNTFNNDVAINDVVKNQVVTSNSRRGDINKDSNKITLSKKRSATLDSQNELIPIHDYELITSYEEGLQYLSALQESLLEGNEKLTLVKRRRAVIDTEIREVSQVLDATRDSEECTSLYSKSFELHERWDEEANQILLLINFLSRQRQRIFEINNLITLMHEEQLKANKLKRFHS